ncbi:MAG: DUF2207 domain-containing protein [Micropruina sp.]
MASRLRLLLAALLALFVLGVAAAPAHAAGADQIDSFTIAYTVRPDGVLEVQETIVLRFGSSSGRHGLERFWVIREPYDDRQDAVYRIEQIDVSSPSGAATQWSRTDSNASDGRLAVMRIRIGDPAVTISQPTATYVLRYHVYGAMRSHQGFDSFYWDATGDRFPLVKNAAVKVEVPGGALDVFCSAAEPGVRADCDRARIRSDKSAEFAHKTLQPGQILTVEVMIAAGLVADNKPHLEERADAAAERFAQGLLIGSGVAAGIIPLIGWWYYRRNGTDKRFVGLPPGVLPIRGQVPREVPDQDVEIPVSFAPPRLPLAVAGLLLDGTTQVRHTTATLVGLAVSGAIKLRSGPDPEARLIDPRRVPDKPSDLLLDSIFDSGQTSVALDVQGALSEGHDDIVKYVARQADQGKWFVRRSPRKAAGSVGIGIAAAAFSGFVTFGSAVLMVIPVAVSLIATVAVVSAKLTRGQRSGVGRALTDQVEGFRTYLATAEADQLRFEEGEDIFSKYLPWAVLFDLADRWAKVCAELVEQGRLDPRAPLWYYGDAWNVGNMGGSMDRINSSVATAAFDASSFSSGTGFGGGSSFSSGGSSGGGSSGGGGGGGGGGSW